jgi:hypothetical protein
VVNVKDAWIKATDKKYPNLYLLGESSKVHEVAIWLIFHLLKPNFGILRAWNAKCWYT